jgi:hypothetical protein
MPKALFLLCILSLALYAPALFADTHHGHNLTINSGDSDSTSCDDHLRISSDELDANVKGEEVKTLPNQKLNVSGDHNGSIHLTNWERPEVELKLCKSVAADNETTAREALKQISISIQNGQVSVTGPERNDHLNWASLIMIQAPRGANFILSAHNGGISIRSFSGEIEAETVNGGISLKNSDGKAQVRARNGGISIQNCNGDVHAEVQNGGLSLKLADDWQGTGLEASTRNGGVMVSIPKTFHSSLEIAASNHTQMLCRGDACNLGQRTWDDERKIFRIGSSPAKIKASTVNGAVVISDPESKVAREFD